MENCILLIDDEPRYRNGLGNMLPPVLPEGWTFFAPENLTTALSLAADPKVRIILVDHTLSMHGYQDPEFPMLKGWNVCARILATRNDAVLIAFSKGNNGTMREHVGHAFSGKQHLLDEDAAQIRQSFLDFILNVLKN